MNASDTRRGPALLDSDPLQHALGQPADVFRPFAQRRQTDSDDGEPVEQVFAEGAGRHVGVQIAVRRRDDAEVAAGHLLRARAEEAAFLQRAQELGLHAGRQFSDLAEEERAAVRALQVAAVHARAPVKAFFS